MRQFTVTIVGVKAEGPRYGIDELAELGGVSRRTVRYYIQEGLLPQPLGVGRGNHYAREHLDALLRVKSMQEAGLTLDAIRQSLSGKPVATAAAPALQANLRSVWRRFTLGPGVELHVRGDAHAPPASVLEGLAEWYRAHHGRAGDGDPHDDNH
jgi:DNA-binding transcriptional MerR regulator